MPKLVTKKIRNIIKQHVSLNSKIMEVHCKNTCANGKSIKKTSKVRPKSISQSMNNRYEFNARKRGTQKMTIHQQRIWKLGKNEKRNMRTYNKKQNVDARAGEHYKIKDRR